MKPQHSPWLVRQVAPTCRLRLYCFCYAGGSASAFANWQADLDPSIEVVAVELPGRGRRFGEPPTTSLKFVSETVGRLIAAEGDIPFAFFGHSLGALIAFEVTRFLQQNHLPMPQELMVSGASAPQYRRKMHLHLLDDDTLIDELRKYNGTPPAVLEHRELMELLLPMIRADFSIAGEYEYVSAPVLNLPLTVLMGREDDNADGNFVDGWKKETSGECHIAWFEGGHFFIHSQRAAVLECIKSRLHFFLGRLAA
ncbi:MAG: alpha/beta fold hydrolase [Sideroxyarcus sp.]|nr:alpha/beta fold hydrolase [Sideroxyarcus sp.]